MKNILKIAATLSLLSGAAVADPVLGVWKTTPDDNGNFGHIKVAECEGEICGTLIKSFDPLEHHTNQKISVSKLYGL